MCRPRIACLIVLVGTLVGCGRPTSDAPGSEQPEDTAAETSTSPVEGTPSTEAAEAFPADAAGEATPQQVVEAPDYRRAPTLASTDPVGVLDFLPELEMAPSAGEWGAWHPEWAGAFRLYDVNPFDEAPEEFGNSPRWCLRTFVIDAPGAADSTITRLSGSDVSRVTFQRLAEAIQAPVTLRWFYFYGGDLPDVPDDYARPDFTDGIDYQLASCTLGLVAAERIGVSVPDTALAELTVTYATRFGDSVPTERALYGLDSEVTTWLEGEATVGVGARRTGDLVAFAFLPSMGTAFSVWNNNYRALREWEAGVFAKAIEEAALTGEAATILETFRFREAPNDYHERRQAVLSFLRHAIERPAGLTPGTPTADSLAARLVTADLFLASYYDGLPFPPPDAEFTDFMAWMRESARPFEELGATYRPSALEGGLYYARSLADSAAAMASPGGWGDRLQIMTFEEGCNWEPTIDRGLPMLDRIEEPGFRALLHFFLGEAYASIVHFDQRRRLREGVIDDIDEIRRLAVEHYLAAIDGDLPEQLKASAWHYAFAMAHNLRLEPRYSCERA